MAVCIVGSSPTVATRKLNKDHRKLSFRRGMAGAPNVKSFILGCFSGLEEEEKKRKVKFSFHACLIIAGGAICIVLIICGLDPVIPFIARELIGFAIESGDYKLEKG